MIKTLTVVIADGSVPAGTIEPLEPFAQRIDIPRGEDSVIRLKIRKADGSRFDITGWDIRFAVRRQLADASAMFTRVATDVQPVDLDDDPQWDAEVELDQVDTLGLIEKKAYHFDVQLTDASDNRWQGVPDSVFHILPIVGQVDEPILPPLVDEGAPIAIGPPGPAGPAGADGADGPQGPPGDSGVLSDDLPLGLGAASAGVGISAPRWDHVHPHGNLATSASLYHALAVAGGNPGFMSGTMAQQLADLVAADFGGQITTVAGNLATLTTAVGGHTTTLSSHTSSLSALGAVKYIVQVADAAVPNAQALGALGTGILKSTTSTGVVSIAAAADIPSLLTTKGDLLGYSTLPVRVPVEATDGWVLTIDAASAAGWKWAEAAGGGVTDHSALTNLAADDHTQYALLVGRAGGQVIYGDTAPGGTLTLVSTFHATKGFVYIGSSTGVVYDGTNVRLGIGVAPTVDFDLTKSVSGGAVSGLLWNSSNTASSTARLAIRTGGASAGNAGLTIGVTGGADWNIDADNATNDRFLLTKGSATHLRIDPTLSLNKLQIYPVSSAGIGLTISDWAASGDSRVGVYISPVGAPAANYLTLTPDRSGTAGMGLQMVAFNGTKFTNLLSYVNPTANQPTLRLVENGGQITSLGTNTVASGASAVWDARDFQAATLTLSGSTNITTATGVNMVDVKAPTITSGSAITVTNAATVRIAGAPVAAGSTTITNKYSLWIDAGLPRIDSSSANGSVATVLGSVGPAGSNTTVQEWLTVDLGGTTRYIPCF